LADSTIAAVPQPVHLQGPQEVKHADTGLIGLVVGLIDLRIPHFMPLLPNASALPDQSQ